MIDLDFLQKLIKAVDESGVDFIEIDRGGTHIRVGKTPPPAPIVTQGAPAAAAVPGPGAGGTGGASAEVSGAPAPAADAGSAEPVATPSNLIEVKSPMVGTFYRSPSPDDAPYAEVGARISKGDALCIIEAMKLMNELEAEVEGTVVEVCVENAQPVEYGQVLFRLEPA